MRPTLYSGGLYLCKTVSIWISVDQLNRVCAPDFFKFSNPKLKSHSRFYPHLSGIRGTKFIPCLYISSSIASFVWKPAHFEFRSYGGARHNAKIAFVEKYAFISSFLAILEVQVSGKVLCKYFLVRFK